MNKLDVPTKPERHFVPDNLNLDNWDELESLLKNLTDRPINSVADLDAWLKDRSELSAVISENVGRRYIAMTVDTTDVKAAESYEYFVSEISPKISPYEDRMNRKLVDSEWTAKIDKEGFKVYLRGVEAAIEIYRKENDRLHAEDTKLAQLYSGTTGKQTITYRGKELTMQQAGVYLKDTDREVRKEVYDLMAARRLEDETALNSILSEMIEIRTKIAKNAGFDNYRDYKFKAMGRFDYTPEDCKEFHNAIEKHILPITKKIAQNRKDKLGYETLKPYDTAVSLDGKPPLKPFSSGNEMLSKTKSMFYKIDDYFGECLSVMDEMNHLDLESKVGKAPGGYNYPLYEIGVPFIFMNSVGLHRDLVTMVHEGGHAVHSFLSKDLELTNFKSLTSEIAELASMSMELMSMEYWTDFYEGKDDLKKARREQLEGVLEVLPWVATIDAFQHWIYENLNHSVEERKDAWVRINNRFSSGVADWTDYKDYKAAMWQRQLHIFEVPFYYIEYAMAQLGAIGVWKNYLDDPKKAVSDYKSALALGYTKTIPEVYETAGISFNFSSDYVRELADFVLEHLEKEVD